MARKGRRKIGLIAYFSGNDVHAELFDETDREDTDARVFRAREQQSRAASTLQRWRDGATAPIQCAASGRVPCADSSAFHSALALAAITLGTSTGAATA